MIGSGVCLLKEFYVEFWETCHQASPYQGASRTNPTPLLQNTSVCMHGSGFSIMALLFIPHIANPFDGSKE
jgi:hypothetical protein